MKAIIKDIQVCGVGVYYNLHDACAEYLRCVDNGTDREKMSFQIVLSTGDIKHITIRQEEGWIAIYGDLGELPGFIEFAKEVLG